MQAARLAGGVAGDGADLKETAPETLSPFPPRGSLLRAQRLKLDSKKVRLWVSHPW